MSNFNDFDLNEKILKTIQELNYKTPTPIQEQAIPKIREGLDLIASAQTGTGKTAAFLLPLLHNIYTEKKGHRPRMLVLVPTRELALQIAAESEKYSRNLQLKTVCIYGGSLYHDQKKALSRHYDILVATPGRLMDLMDQGLIDLSKLDTLVLDEADRMLDMGFIEAVEDIASQTPKSRQTLLFSATINNKIVGLSNKLQNNPVKIHIKPDELQSSHLQQRLYMVDGMHHKMALLDHILENETITQAIIFIATKSSADSLARELQDKGYLADALHGDRNQRQRTKTITKLRQGKINLLVATDVAGRGIDIPFLSHVINIDLPFQAEDYIHRIGRTGRAGQKGIAITFAARKEGAMLSKIQKLFESPIQIHTIAGLEPKDKKAPTSDTAPPKKRNARFSHSRNSESRNSDFRKERGSAKSFKKPFQKKKKGAFSPSFGLRSRNAK